MASVGIKLRSDTYGRVKRLAEEQQTTMQEIVSRGIDALERQEFATGFQRDFAALRQDQRAWTHELAEREELEHTLSDGLSE
jgi:predicted transcriptional regulator